jgi:putative ABC transport system permease protein
MLSSIIRTSTRIWARNKVYTAINLTGLVLGLTSAFILLVFIINEQSFNNCFKQNQKLFRVILKDPAKGIKIATPPFPLANALENNIPEITLTTRIVFPAFETGPVSVKRDSNFIVDPQFMCADASIIRMLELNMLRSQPWKLLETPKSVIISKRAADLYFGDKDPLNQQLEIKSNGMVHLLNVEGVFENFPWNSTVQADFITGIGFYLKIFETIMPDAGKYLDSYDASTSATLIMLRNADDLPEVVIKIDSLTGTAKSKHFDWKIELQSVRDIYLQSEEIQNDFSPKGRGSNLLIYMILALFILLLAGVNYSILSTARSALRFKEIGVRKVLGASRGQLRWQILAESVMFTFVAFPLAFLLLGLIDPFVYELYGYKINLHRSNMWIYLLLFSGITLAIGLLSGSYIALYLSALDPLNALRLKLFSYNKFSLGKVFIVFQLLITLALLVGFITVFRQINFLLTKDVGFNKENLLLVSFDPSEFSGYEQLKSNVAGNPNILYTSGTSVAPPDNAGRQMAITLPGSEEKRVTIVNFMVDYHFFTTMGIDFTAGSDFSPADSLHKNSIIIVNQEMMRTAKIKNIIKDSIGPYRIKGVVKEFNISSLHHRVMPSLFQLNPEACMTMIVRFKSGKEEQVIQSIGEEWNKLAPTLPFNYRFFDQELRDQYANDKNFASVVASFTFLAFVITGMGLFGLALLLSERKRKEVAIRKVFGASNLNIVYEMQKDFIIYIAVATIMAIPASWFALDAWLATFIYQVSLPWYIFVLATLAVALFVSAILLFRTRKILTENPMNALKYE